MATSALPTLRQALSKTRSPSRHGSSRSVSGKPSNPTDAPSPAPGGNGGLALESDPVDRRL
jgi:hypothetical protein